MATGYTKGDPSKLDRAGDTMTGPLILSGAPTQALHAATKAYVDAAPGGGGGAGVPAITVVSETAFGQAAAVGTGTMQAREDHTHGTPAAPTAASVGADPTGTAAGQVAAHGAAPDPHGDRAHTDTGLAGKATKQTVRRAYITTGDVTLAANATWTALTGFELDLPAAVGDYVELHPSFMHNGAGSDFLDLAVLVGSDPVTIMRRSSTGTNSGTANDEGDPSIYPSPGSFRTSGALFDFVVQAGDLDGGNVRFALIVRGAGGSKVYASTSYPFRWRALNHGPVN